MNSLDRMIALAVRIAEREGLLYEDDSGSFLTATNNQHPKAAASPSDVCHSPAIPFSNIGGTVGDEKGEAF